MRAMASFLPLPNPVARTYHKGIEVCDGVEVCDNFNHRSASSRNVTMSMYVNSASLKNTPLKTVRNINVSINLD